MGSVKYSSKQHYVPQFYLKNFCQSKTNLLYCYDKTSNNRFLTNIQNIAEENLFYGINRLIRDEFEKSFSKAETKYYSPSYQEFLKKKNYSIISYESKKWFFVFLAFQMIRTLQARKIFKESYKSLIRELRKEKLAKKLDKQVSFVEKNLTNDDFFKAVHLKSLLPPYDKLFELAKFFFNKKWVILTNRTDIQLWTSDHPLSFYNSFNYEGNLGILSKGVEIRFPLSKNLLLYSYDPRTTPPKLNKEKISNKEVEFANMCQLRSSTRFVYSPENKFEPAKQYLEKYPKFKDPDRNHFSIFTSGKLIEYIVLE